MLALLPGPGLSAPDLLEPAPGRFLVAQRQIEGSMFARSIVLLIEASEKGASGLIVNRPTQIRLPQLMNVPAERDDPIHLGGPLAPNGMLFLTRAADPPAGSRRIRGPLHLGESADGLRALIARDEPPARLRTFLGHAGWAPGQLDHEIARGDWFVIEGDAALAFEARGDESWEAALAPFEALRVRATVGERVAFRRGSNEVVYPVRGLQEPPPAIGADPLRCTRDADGSCKAVRLCEPDEECAAPFRERAWSSPIFLRPGGA